jgi:hypothetical protein
LKPINNNGSNSQIDFDPDCVFNKLGKGKIVNEKNNINVDSLSNSIQDNVITEYAINYTGYETSQTALINTDNNISTTNQNYISNTTQFQNGVKDNFDAHKDNLNVEQNSKLTNIIEGFENNNNNNKKLIYILIIFLFICILFYFLTKKN